MIKVVHIISGIGGGGRERRMGQIVIDLLHKQYGEQHIVYLSKSNVDYPEIINSGATLHLLKYHNKYELVLSLRNMIRQILPNIVHVWTEIPIILLTVAGLKLSYRYKLVIGFLADGNIIKRLRSILITQLSYLFADAIVSNSYAGLKAKGASGKKCHVIYNGFDFNRLETKCQDGFLREYSDGYKCFVCMVARFSPAKDWNMFFKVAEKVSMLRQDILFFAVGAGDTLAFYEQLVKDRNILNVRFLGRRNDVENVIRFCNISLLFSNSNVHAEGVSNVIMETMASSKPIIATEGGGTAEIINNNFNGYIIAPGDVDAAVNIIMKLINDPEETETISHNAYETITSRFRQADKTQEYINLYNSIL